MFGMNGNGYDDDVDRSRVIRRAFWTCNVLLIGLVALEIAGIWTGRQYMTPELLHSITSGVLGWISGIVMALWSINPNEKGAYGKEQEATDDSEQTPTEETEERDWL